MNRNLLKNLLEREGVAQSAYSLEGGTPFEAYVLEKQGPTWTVFYSERGLRSGQAEFKTESEACVFLLELILRDPTTRRDAWRGE